MIMTEPRSFPPMPTIGRPESYYAKKAQEAEAAGDQYAHEAAKVGQYVTLALDDSLAWDEKVKYFKHALRRHCRPPEMATDEAVTEFFKNLAAFVRRHAGTEALRLASREDDVYAMRVGLGQDREAIEEEADAFFAKLVGVGDQVPEWFDQVDWEQLRLIRDQWI